MSQPNLPDLCVDCLFYNEFCCIGEKYDTNPQYWDRIALECAALNEMDRIPYFESKDLNISDREKMLDDTYGFFFAIRNAIIRAKVMLCAR